MKKILVMICVLPAMLLQAMDEPTEWPTAPGKAIAKPVWELDGSLALSRRAYDLYGNSFSYVDNGEARYKFSMSRCLEMGADHEYAFNLRRLWTEEATTVKVELDYLESDIALSKEQDFEYFFLKSSEPVVSYRLQFEQKGYDSEIIEMEVRRLVLRRYVFVKRLAANGGLERIQEIRKMIRDQATAMSGRELQRNGSTKVASGETAPARAEVAGLNSLHASLAQHKGASNELGVRETFREEDSVSGDHERARHRSECGHLAGAGGTEGRWFSYKKAAFVGVLIIAAIVGKKYYQQEETKK